MNRFQQSVLVSGFASMRSRLVMVVVMALFASGLPVDGGVRVAFADPGDPTALLVTETGTVTSQEAPLVSRLELLGFVVETVPDEELTARSTLGVAVVVVPSTVASVELPGKLTKVSAPVISMKAFGHMMMAMSGPSSVDPDGGGPGRADFGTVSSAAVSIALPAHPLAAGLTGSQTITTTTNPVGWAVMPSGVEAQTVATVGGDPALFAWSFGDVMFDGILAHGCRVGFPSGADSPSEFTTAGWGLFDAAVEWSQSSECYPDRVHPESPPARSCMTDPPPGPDVPSTSTSEGESWPNWVDDVLYHRGVFYLAGRFTSVRNWDGSGEVARAGLAACDAATGNVLSWNPGLTLNAGTDTVRLQGNLPSAAALSSVVTESVTVYDRDRNPVSLTITFTKSGTEKWDVAVATSPSGGVFVDSEDLPVSRTMTFDGGGGLISDNTYRVSGAPNMSDFIVDFGALGDPTQVTHNSGAESISVLSVIPAQDKVRTLLADGSWLYAGGNFTVSATKRNLVRIGLTSGTVDTTWGPNIRGGVQALLVDGSSLYVGGGIHTIDDTEPVGQLLKLNKATGARDTGFSMDLVTDPPPGNHPYTGKPYDDFASVQSLAVYGAKLFVGGLFTEVNSTSGYHGVATVNKTTGGLITGFNPDLSDPNNYDPFVQIHDIFIHAGAVYMCGDWWVTEGQGQLEDPGHDALKDQQYNIGKFNINTGASYRVPVPEGAHADRPWGPRTDGAIQACDIDTSSGLMYLGGHFDLTNSLPIADLAVIDLVSGDLLQTWDVDPNRIRGLDALEVVPGVAVAGGGTFDNIGASEQVGFAVFSVAAGAPGTPEFPHSPVSGQPLSIAAPQTAGHTKSGTSTVVDPINTASGNLTGTWTDLAEPGLGMSVVRSYNGLSDLSSAMGAHWSLSTGPQLLDGTALVEVVLPDGSRYSFAEDGLGGYVAPDGIAGAMTVDPATPIGGGSLPMLRIEYANSAVDRFDTAGRLIEQLSWDGQQADLVYNGSGLLSTVTSTTGTVLTFAYSSGRPISVTSSTGRAIGYGYNGTGLLSTVSDEFGAVTTIDYTVEGWLETMTDPAGVVLEDNVYDAEGRVIAQTLPSGAVVTLSYSEDGVTTVTDSGTGAVVDYVHDSEGKIIEIRDPKGNSSRKTYDANDNLVGSVSRSEREGAATYDADYNLTSVTEPGYGTTTYTYDAQNRMLTSTDPYAATTTYTYQGSERMPTTVTDALTNTTTYDIVDGLVMSVTDPDGVTTTNTYDTDRRLTSTTDEYANTTTYTYDTEGRLLTTTTPEGLVTTSTYDAAGRLESTTTPGSAVTSYTYDDAGRILTVTDPVNAVTTYTYNAAGQQETITDPVGAVTTFEYDTNGRLVATVAPGGARTETGYDTLRRPITETTPLGDEHTTLFDVEGRPVNRSVGSTGATSVTEYDPDGRVLATVDPLDRRVENTFDTHGRILETTAPGAAVTAYEYDLLGRTTETLDARGATTTTTYTPGGRVETVTDAAGLITSYEYDDAGRLETTVLPGAREHTTTYNDDGQPLTETAPGGLVTTYTYNSAGRVATSTDPAGVVTTRTYTARGELATEKVGLYGTATYAYNPSGTLASVTDPLGNTTTFTYDGRGNMLTRTDELGGVETWTYNDNNQVTSATDQLDRETTYTYNTAGQLISSTDPAGRTSNTTYNLDGTPAAVSFDDGVATLDTTYSYDDAGRIDGITADSETSTYNYNPAGDLLARTDPTGTLGWEYDLAGRRTLMRYPDGRGVHYTYNTAGQLASITQAEELIDHFTGANGTNPSTINFDETTTSGTVAIQSNTARLAVTNTANAVAMITAQVAARQDTNTTLNYTWDATTSGATLVAYARYTSNGHYRIEIPAGSTTGTVYKRIGGTNTTLGTITLANSTGGNLRLKLVGNTLSITSWATGTNEPGTPTGTWTSSGVTTNGQSRVTLKRDSAAGAALVDDWVQSDPTNPTVVAGYTYNTAGLITSETRPGGTVTRAYTNGRLTTFTETLPGASRTTTLTYDTDGRIKTETTSGITTTYDYDLGSQLIAATPSSGDISEWEYDELGRRTLERIGTSYTKYQYDQASQLCWSTTGTMPGSPTCAAPPVNAATFTWDDSGRLVNETRTNNEIDYTYDPAGRINAATRVNGTTTTSHTRTYHPDGLIAALDNTVVTPSTTTVTNHDLTWDPLAGNVPQLATIATGGTPTNLSYGPGGWAALQTSALTPTGIANDAHGSVIPSTGSTLARSSTYAAFGTPTGTNTFEPRLGYRGELTIDANLYLRARTYQAALGILTSRDPAPGRPGTTTLTNPYHYADNSPLNRVDPTGRITDKAANGFTPGTTNAYGSDSERAAQLVASTFQPGEPSLQEQTMAVEAMGLSLPNFDGSWVEWYQKINVFYWVHRLVQANISAQSGLQVKTEYSGCPNTRTTRVDLCLKSALDGVWEVAELKLVGVGGVEGARASAQDQIRRATAAAGDGARRSHFGGGWPDASAWPLMLGPMMITWQNRNDGLYTYQIDGALPTLPAWRDLKSKINLRKLEEAIYAQPLPGFDLSPIPALAAGGAIILKGALGAAKELRKCVASAGLVCLVHA